jgi:hypothetical protein
VVNGKIQGEWSDITPLAFHSPTSTTDTFHATTIGAADANSLLYAGLDPGGDELYLMYDYGPGLQQNFANGGSADVTFPLLQTNPDGSQAKRLVDVNFQIAPQSQGSGGGTPAAVVQAPSVTVTFEDTGQPVPASAVGFDAAAGFGPSTLTTAPHLLAELGVPLTIASGFASPGSVLPANGEQGFLFSSKGSGGGNTFVGYSPDPAFWGASVTPGSVGPPAAASSAVLSDPQASSALFQILPSGKTVVNSNKLVNDVVAFDLSTGGSANNPIILEGDGSVRNKDVLSVTLHSTATFDATQVNLKTIRLGDARDFDDSAKPFAMKTVTNTVTGLTDVVLLFHGEDIKEALNSHSSTLLLTGKTMSGAVFGGSELVFVKKHDVEPDGDKDDHHRHGHD